MCDIEKDATDKTSHKERKEATEHMGRETIGRFVPTSRSHFHSGVFLHYRLLTWKARRVLAKGLILIVIVIVIGSV